MSLRLNIGMSHLYTSLFCLSVYCLSSTFFSSLPQYRYCRCCVCAIGPLHSASCICGPEVKVELVCCPCTVWYTAPTCHMSVLFPPFSSSPPTGYVTISVVSFVAMRPGQAPFVRRRGNRRRNPSQTSSAASQSQPSQKTASQKTARTETDEQDFSNFPMEPVSPMGIVPRYLGPVAGSPQSSLRHTTHGHSFLHYSLLLKFCLAL